MLYITCKNILLRCRSLDRQVFSCGSFAYGFLSFFFRFAFGFGDNKKSQTERATQSFAGHAGVSRGGAWLSPPGWWSWILDGVKMDKKKHLANPASLSVPRSFILFEILLSVFHSRSFRVLSEHHPDTHLHRTFREALSDAYGTPARAFGSCYWLPKPPGLNKLN